MCYHQHVSLSILPIQAFFVISFADSGDQGVEAATNVIWRSGTESQSDRILIVRAQCMTTEHSLSSRAAISPNVPRAFSSLLPNFFDLRACQSFVIAVIPFPNSRCDLDLGVCADGLFVRWLSCLLPRHSLCTPKLQELQSSLCAFPRRYIASTPTYRQLRLGAIGKQQKRGS